MGGSITYDEVAIKLNEWYSAIKKDQITDAEFLKADVKRLFDSMEENQTVLLYFSLLEFRHDLMLSYLKPKLSSQELDEYMVQINEQKHKIDQSLHEDKDQIEKMLDFYFWFFKGMHEFRKKQFDEA
ncbi:hypothetical protein J2W90_002531, partial [Bacillus pumilus]|uniref:response regulator aspartate phosphatase n=2 Tax=Bacillus TaxID=1386 RepID=UPI002866B9E9|nr:hypothetical protein [Bacillus pumilus]